MYHVSRVYLALTPDTCNLPLPFSQQKEPRISSLFSKATRAFVETKSKPYCEADSN